MTEEQRYYESEQAMALLTEREYLVVKSNQLVQKNRYELSLQEQKVIAFICSMIKPVEPSPETYGKPFQLEYEFDIREYCRVCGLDYDNGKNYIDIKATLKGLRDKSMWLTMPDGSESLCGWLSKANVNKQSGRALIKLDEDLVPYLFDLKQKFTQYKLMQVLCMKSAFSIRVYELMKSYANMRRAVFEIDELKRLLMVQDVKSYVNFKDFRIKVLETALREINKYTDLNVSYQTVKKGRKVIRVVFDIVEKQEPELSQAINEADWALSQNYLVHNV